MLTILNLLILLLDSLSLSSILKKMALQCTLNVFFSRVGTNPPEPLSPNLDGDSVPSYPHHHNHQHPIVNRSGQILWIRGLTRLQTQVCPFASTIIYVEIYTSEFTRRLGMNFKIVKFQ